MNGEMDINIQLILMKEKGLKPGLSTSQNLMAGLALCKPSMLKAEGYNNPREAWNRLDESQRNAIVNFRKFVLTKVESN